MEDLKEVEIIPRDTVKTLEKASLIYEALEDKDIFKLNSIPYNNIDKKCLALFLGLLQSDNSASKIMEDFGINSEIVFNALKISKPSTSGTEDMNIFSTLLRFILDNCSRYYTRELTPTLLLSKLFLEKECGSDFLSDIYRKLGIVQKEATEHSTYAFLTKQIEAEEEKSFGNLEKKAKDKPKKSQLENDGTLDVLGLNPYNIDFSFGRDEEVKKLMVTLLMPGKSAILVGPAGVGKTAIVKGLAHRIASGKVPEYFLDKRIVSLNVAALVSGCKLVGMFEEKLIKALNNLSENDIVFIDEVHTIVGAGKGKNSANDMANILKPYLESGKIKVIGATTTEEYEEYIKSDGGLKRRFELVKVKEPDKETLESICYNAITRLELEMDMFFLEDPYQVEIILKELINLTDKQNRVYNDMVNNPDLIISIITRSFALSKYYGKIVVEISDLLEAIQDNDRLYSHSKTKFVKRVQIAMKPQKKPSKTKIISFESLV